MKERFFTIIFLKQSASRTELRLMEPAEQAHLFEEYADLFGKQKSFTECLLDVIPVAYTTGVLVFVAHRVLLLFLDDMLVHRKLLGWARHCESLV